MSIKFAPHKILSRLSKSQLEKLITSDFRINRQVIATVQRLTGLPQRELEDIILKVLKQYKKSYTDNLKKGMKKTEARQEALNDYKLLQQKINVDVVYKTSEHLKQRYKGKKYKWLPSSARTPDPRHQLKYGKVYTLGKGEAPQDRYGCQCGMEIIVDDDYTI